MKNLTHERIVRLAGRTGCHQIPERSFFIKGMQFPVCARCTGVLAGNLAAYALFFIYAIPPEFCVLGCAMMFIDWFIQYIGIRESTNIRRLITGIIGGYSLATLYCTVIKYIAQLLIKL